MNKTIGFTHEYLEFLKEILDALDTSMIDLMAEFISNAYNNGGRLFIVGNGGSAGSASHAVNDFRKIVGMDAATPTDNVSELTARINDDGFDNCFVDWLRTCNLYYDDVLMVLSVGGGNKEKNISGNIVKAVEYAHEQGAAIIGIVGRDGGYTYEIGDAVLKIPNFEPSLVTPIVESFHSIITHLLVSHPLLKSKQTKWESVDKGICAH
jgi:D-sedoheptulose 7-phosphate isomerase